MNLRWHVFYLGLISLLLAALLWQGAKLQQTAFQSERQVAPRALYEDIRRSSDKYQIVDVRPAAEFEDGHLPRAIPLKPETAPLDAALDRYKRTVIVSEDGDPAVYAELARAFKRAANLDGGMMQWRMSRLPEISGLTDIEGLRRGRAG